MEGLVIIAHVHGTDAILFAEILTPQNWNRLKIMTYLVVFTGFVAQKQKDSASYSYRIDPVENSTYFSLLILVSSSICVLYE